MNYLRIPTPKGTYQLCGLCSYPAPLGRAHANGDRLCEYCTRCPFTSPGHAYAFNAMADASAHGDARRAHAWPEPDSRASKMMQVLECRDWLAGRAIAHQAGAPNYGWAYFRLDELVEHGVLITRDVHTPERTAREYKLAPPAKTSQCDPGSRQAGKAGSCGEPHKHIPRECPFCTIDSLMDLIRTLKEERQAPESEQ